ncbi:MAG TPA: trans-aconitate 2-methyltransferase [Streptosporangiaceae bacterium]|nr:trans-aconitate 2-methyltransferase [Streptosporangiaceae bacterium]
MWDPVQYQRFADERSRPFADLTARIGASEPGTVVDLGCGPGHLTADLGRRWPGAVVHGLDSSLAMIEDARQLAKPPRLTFELADLREWRPAAPVDVIVSNAVLQWVPDHLDLLPRWVNFLAPGGWLAFQLPGNFDQPPHVAISEMAASPRWRPLLGDREFTRQAGDLAGYLDVLAGAGCRVDAWETTYLHVLAGENPVVEWVKGTALRPVLSALDDEQAAEFLAGYSERMRRAYPPRPFGTVLPFRRVFMVAQRPA